MSQDYFHRFLFENAAMRGGLVRLEASWRAVLAEHGYPDFAAEPLGQALAATLLMSATLKNDSTLILQVRGDGPVSLLVAQATSKRTVRGLARWREDSGEPDETDALGNGHLVMTIVQSDGQRYQGVTALQGEGLAAALENYFQQSEQLQTRFWLAADREAAAGLMIQELPGRPAPDDDDIRARILMLADTLTHEELLKLPAEDLLRRLFHEEQPRLFEPEPVAFRCTCSRDKIADTLRAIGREDIESLLDEHDLVEVDCEFCNRHYAFDRVDVAGLFIDGPVRDDSATRH